LAFRVTSWRLVYECSGRDEGVGKLDAGRATDTPRLLRNLPVKNDIVQRVEEGIDSVLVGSGQL